MTPAHLASAMMHAHLRGAGRDAFPTFGQAGPKAKQPAQRPPGSQENAERHTDSKKKERKP